MRLVTIGLKGLAALAFTGIALGASLASAAPLHQDGYRAGHGAQRVAHHHRHRHHHHHRHAVVRR